MQKGCQLVLLEKVTQRFSGVALKQAGLLMTMIASDAHCLPHRSLWSTNLSAVFEWLSDVICIAYVTHLQIVISERRRKRSKRVPKENAEWHPWGFSHIWRCLPSKSFASTASVRWSPAVREELMSAPIKGKMPILHRVSEQPQSINQPAGKETDSVYLCLSVSVGAHTSALISVYYSTIFEKGL